MVLRAGARYTFIQRFLFIYLIIYLSFFFLNEGAQNEWKEIERDREQERDRGEQRGDKR